MRNIILLAFISYGFSAFAGDVVVVNSQAQQLVPTCPVYYSGAYFGPKSPVPSPGDVDIATVDDETIVILARAGVGSCVLNRIGQYNDGLDLYEFLPNGHGNKAGSITIPGLPNAAAQFRRAFRAGVCGIRR